MTSSELFSFTQSGKTMRHRALTSTAFCSAPARPSPSAASAPSSPLDLLNLKRKTRVSRLCCTEIMHFYRYHGLFARNSSLPPPIGNAVSPTAASEQMTLCEKHGLVDRNICTDFPLLTIRISPLFIFS